jgi:dipeptidyl aminopeptidase/acylaminoacyl peptidase
MAELPAEEIESLHASAREGRCRKIRYRSDGLAVVGFVLEPPVPGPSPAILVARGGNRDLGTIGPRLLAELNALADQGFVIVATQYRGADGGEGADEFGGADLADLENLVPLARGLPSVDPDNLFLLGYSRGGMMAAMALRRDLPVQAAALFSGVYDLESQTARPEMEQNFRDLIPGYEENRTEELRRRSAVFWADEIETPVLILGGTEDQRVPFDANAGRLAELLAQAGREYKLARYEDEHTLSHFHLEATREIGNWFRQHAQPQQ